MQAVISRMDKVSLQNVQIVYSYRFTDIEWSFTLVIRGGTVQMFDGILPESETTIELPTSVFDRVLDRAHERSHRALRSSAVSRLDLQCSDFGRPPACHEPIVLRGEEGSEVGRDLVRPGLAPDRGLHGDSGEQQQPCIAISIEQTQAKSRIGYVKPHYLPGKMACESSQADGGDRPCTGAPPGKC